MPRDEGIDVRKPAPKPAATTPRPPAWKNKPVRKQKDDEAGNDPQPQTASGPQYVPPGLSQPQRPTAAAQFTPPKWWNTLSNNVSNWIDNNVSGSQYVPAGLSQPQRPTTAAQFRPPVWGGNPMQVSEPFNPTLPTGTFFAGGNTVRTGEASGQMILTTNPLNQRPRWSNGLAPAGEAGRPFQPSVTGYNLKSTSLTNSGGSNGGGWGTTYKKKGGGGGGYRGYNDYSGYSSDRVPSWLMNLTNWNFKG